MRRFLRYALLFLLVFAAAVFLLNTNLFAARFDGAIWTNRVDRIGPAVRAAP